MSYFQTFGGDPVQPAYSGYVAVPLAGNVQMSWPIQFQNTNLNVSNFMDVEPTGNGFVLTLPTAEDVSVGMAFIVNNPTAFSFTLNKFDGTLLFNSAAGTSEYCILIDNTTVGGSWRTSPFAAGGTAVTSVNMTSSSNNVVIGGVPITSAGTITLALANDLLQLSSFGAFTGFAVRTAANTWQVRTLQGTANQIAISNPAGIANNPVISLAANLSGITSITAGDIAIGVTAVNTISTINANENLNLSPNGTGLVSIGGGGARINNGQPLFFYADNSVNFLSIEGGMQTVNYSLIWPTVAPGVGQVLGLSAGTQLGWFNVTTFGGPSTVNALARYSTTFGSLENSVVLLDAAGNLTGITSAEISNVFIGGTAGLLPNTIATVNANGNLYFSPNGLGEVQSFANISILMNNALKLFDGGGTFISFQAPNALAQTTIYTLPGTSPQNYQVFATATAGSPNTLINTYMPSNLNSLINGGMNIWQRGTLFNNATVGYPNNNGQYCADMWKLLSNGNDIVSVTKVAGPTGLDTVGASNAWQFTCTNGGAKFGLVQIINNSESVSLLGKQVVVSVTAQGAGTTAMKFAVVGWTGAADGATPTTMINAWNVTGTTPTLAANWAYQGGVYTVALTGNYVTYNSTAQSITIANNVTNVGLFVWCDTTAGVAGNTMAVTGLNLTAGPNFTPFYPDKFSVELLKAKRYFQKDLPYATVPFTINTSTSRGTVIISSINAATNVPTAGNYATVPYEVEMFGGIAPVITIYPLTTTTNTNRSSTNAGADLAANSATVNAALTDRKGFTLQNTSGGNITSTGYIQFHYTADAGF